jgi:hypothetical protein
MLQVEIDQNLTRFENFIYFDLIWPPMVEIDLQTIKCVHFLNQRTICNQKSTIISIYRAPSIFDLHIWEFSIFKASGLPTNLKKIKLNTQKLILLLTSSPQLRKVKKINLKLAHTKKNPAYRAWPSCDQSENQIDKDWVFDFHQNTGSYGHAWQPPKLSTTPAAHWSVDNHATHPVQVSLGGLWKSRTGKYRNELVCYARQDRW